MTVPAGGRGWTLPAAALLTLVLVDLLRVWLPSVMFVVGDVGTTPVYLMGAFALGCLLVPLAAAALLGRVTARSLWLFGVGLAILGRAGVQASPGGEVQVVTTTLGLVGAGIALTGLAAGAPSGHTARVGVLAGLSGAVGLHAALGTLDMTWRPGVAPVLAAALLLAALAVAALRLVADRDWDDAEAAPGPAWPWLLFGPALALIGILSGVPGRAQIATSWADAWLAVALVAAHGLAVAAAIAGPSLPPASTGTAGAGLVLVGTAAALRPESVAALGAQATLAIGIGLTLGASGTVARQAGARRRAGAAAASLLVFGVTIFLYYAVYDIALPLRNRAILLAIAALIGAAALVAGGTGRRLLSPRAGMRAAGAVAVASLALAAVAGVAVHRPPLPASAVGSEGDPVRVALYNIQMGFDPDGRFAVDDLAEVLLAESPDVVVLNEVDRGWLVTGGHDTLRLLAKRLEMRFVFAPAADEVWGNALLSRYPVREVSIERLPRGADPMPRSQLVAVLGVSDTHELGVVATHLSHVDQQGDTRLPQARAVAAAVARLQERDVPTVVLGDLNAEPGSPEVGPLWTLLSTAVPAGTATWPSWEPQRHIDHVLISDELVGRDAAVPRVQASDHLPVAVTLEFLEP